MDEHSQAGREGLYYAYEKGIPVVIMEPLRGGKLVNRLPARAKEIFEHYPIRHTPAQWAFRWLWNQKEVTCVLSGLNSLEMVEENVKNAYFAAENADLTGKTLVIIDDVVTSGSTAARLCTLAHEKGCARIVLISAAKT